MSETYRDCNEWMDKKCGQGKMISSSMVSMRPDIGFFVTVDGMEIPKELFPDEFAAIHEARVSALKKMARHFDDKIKKA